MLLFFSQPERDETNAYSPPSVNLKQTLGSISYGFPTETVKNQSEPKGIWGGETAEYTPTYHTVATVIAPLNVGDWLTAECYRVIGWNWLVHDDVISRDVALPEKNYKVF